jgi:hypothetical protein
MEQLFASRARSTPAANDRALPGEHGRRRWSGMVLETDAPAPA